MNNINHFCFHIFNESVFNNQRSGQYLLNSLPEEASAVIIGTRFDPFYKDMHHAELYEWVEHHLMFKGNEVVAVFNNGKILWEVSDDPDLSSPTE